CACRGCTPYCGTDTVAPFPGGPATTPAYPQPDGSLVYAASAGPEAGALNLQPHLRAELVELRPLRAADWPELFAVASDPLIWAQHPAPDRHLESEFRAFFAGALESGG